MGWLQNLREAWRTHRYSFLSSLTVTLVGLALYAHTYLFEAHTPLAQFLDTVELKTYDTRFRLRGPAPPSPHIVIVGINQATLERLGSWPFSRRHYARMLDHLRADGAAVVGFDINFPKPDETSGLQLVRRARQDYLERTPPARREASYLARLDALEEEADSDARFAEAVAAAGNVVLGYFFFASKAEVGYIDEKAQQEADSLLAFSSYTTRPARDAKGTLPPPLVAIFAGEEGYLAETNLDRFAEAAELRVGYFNFVADADSIFRRAPLVMKYAGAWQGPPAGEANFYPSLDIQILRVYRRVPEHELVLAYNQAGVEAVQVGALRIPTDAQGRLLIRYQGGPFTYSHFSLADVVAGTFPPGTFRDKIVLVGPTAPAIGDFGPTPFAESNHSGVEIHANVLDTILSQRFIHRGPREELIDLGFILLFGAGLGLALAMIPPSRTAPVAAALLAAFLTITYAALVGFHSWLNLLLPGSVLVVNFGSVVAVRLLLEEREKRQVRAAFDQYVPPSVINALMKNPERLKLGGEERELTIMFSDIRGFTALSEKLTPLELTHLLNDYTDEMTDILFHHWGTLDKFQGDAIMAFWGAPYEQDDHAVRACAAALEMSRRVNELCQQWRAEGKPDLDIGLGMSTGPVVVGNMGSRKRFNYTVLGDPVNLASRLEGVNKEYATRILVSESTYQQAADPLAILEKRLCREFNVNPLELVIQDGSERSQRARRVGLYLGHTLQLAPPPLLAERFSAEAETEIPLAVVQVEQWERRHRQLRQFLTFTRRSLRSFIFRQLDWIRVRGKQAPVGIYELLDFGGDANPYARLLKLFDTGLQAYRGQQWDTALEVFETILESHPNDGPARLFAARCRHYRAHPPPPDWDGVYVMLTK